MLSVQPNFVDEIKQYQRIIIVGHPMSGKSTVSQLLSNKLPNHKVFHTDDFIKKNGAGGFFC